VATTLRDGRAGVRIPVRARDFSLLQNVQFQPPIQWEPGFFFPGVKRPGREVNHLSPSTGFDGVERETFIF
jgi:hypothetical protein